MLGSDPFFGGRNQMGGVGGLVQLAIATFGRMEAYERDAQVRYAIALFLAAIALAQ